MTRALRIASVLQGVGWLLIIFWIGDNSPEKTNTGLAFGITSLLFSIPFVFIHNRFGRRY